MSKIKFITPFVTVLLVYLSFSFGEADFNICHWTEGTRYMCMVISVFYAIIGYFLVSNL